MKARRLVVCLLVLVFGASTATAERTAQPVHIPGGILYSDGENAIYQDFATGEKFNLTEDFERPVTGPITISENRTLLAFASNNQVFVRQLPNGTPFRVSSERARNLSISSDNVYLAIETTRGIRAVLIRRTYSRNHWRFGNRLESRFFENASFPLWRRKPPLLNEDVAKRIMPRIQDGIIEEILKQGTVLTDGNLSISQRLQIVGLLSQPFQLRVVTGGSTYRGEFLAKYNEFYRRETREGIFTAQLAKKKDIPFTIPTYMWRIREVGLVEPSSEKQELVFFQKGEDVIYIEYLKERGEWEHLHLKIRPRGRCQSLAARPDGTITYLSSSIVYSENGEVIAERIEGSNLQWVTDSSFLFRGNDGSLYLWNNRETKKLLSDIPEQFCYAPAPLSIDSGTFTIPWQGEFYLGKLQLGWNFPYSSISRFYANISFPDGPSWEVPDRTTPMKIRITLPPQTSYAFVDGINPDNLIEASRHLSSSRPISSSMPARIDFPIEKTLVIKQGGEYIAIRIIEAGYSRVHISKYYHELGVRTEPQGRTFINFYILSSGYPQLTFEWRYWRE